MNPEKPTPINRDPPRRATLVEALAQQWQRETGTDPDEYLNREAPPTSEERLQRDLEVFGIIVQQN